MEHDAIKEARIDAQAEARRQFYAALAKAQSEMVNPIAGSLNVGIGRGAKYVDLATLRDAVVPVLNKHGIAVIQTSRLDYNGPREKDISDDSARVSVDTVLTHTGGHSEIYRGVPIPCVAMDRKTMDGKIIEGKVTAHSTGGAITYGRRYALAALCAVASDHDDDGNSISLEQTVSKAIQKY